MPILSLFVSVIVNLYMCVFLSLSWALVWGVWLRVMSHVYSKGPLHVTGSVDPECEGLRCSLYAEFDTKRETLARGSGPKGAARDDLLSRLPLSSEEFHDCAYALTHPLTPC